MPYRLRYLAHDLELPIGEFVVGRSTDCQLSLDDPLVSRRHAVLRVRRDGVSVQDFGSRNGVLVNGVKISGERELAAGDKVSIGSQEMVLQAATDAHPLANAGEEVYRRATQTLGAAYVMDLRSAIEARNAVEARNALNDGAAGNDPRPKPRPPAEAPGTPPLPLPGLDGGYRPQTPGAPVSSPQTPRKEMPPPPPLADPPSAEASRAEASRADASRSVQSFNLLGGVADKALAMGKAEDAERILQVLLTDVITRARDGTAVDPGVAEPAARYAARLAGATSKASWVEYVFELYRRQRRVLPAAVIDELYSVVRKVKGLELSGVRAYLDALREMSAAFGPAERFLVQRVEGLERQMALK